MDSCNETTTPPTPPSLGDPPTRYLTRSHSRSLPTATTALVPAPAPAAPEPPTCNICLFPTSRLRADPTTPPELLAALPCGHTFGHQCLLQWLRSTASPSCPMCRRGLVHRGCGHAVMPALASRAGALAPSGGGGLEALCVLCAGMRGEMAELLRTERRRAEAEREALRVLARMPGVGGGPAQKGEMEERRREVEERIRMAEGRWEGGWVACQEVERGRW